MGPARVLFRKPSRRWAMASLLAFVTIVISRGASRNLLPRNAAPGSRVLPHQPTSVLSKVRVTSANPVPLGRNASRSRPGIAKKRSRRGCGGTPGGGSCRVGRAKTRARGVRSSPGEESAALPLGFWEAGDVVWGKNSRGRQGNGGKRAAAGKGGGALGKEYKMHRAGGTFSAKGIYREHCIILFKKSISSPSSHMK